MTTPSDILPFDNDSYDPTAPQKPGQAVLGMDFAYIGQALTVAEFVTYIDGYAFGTVPPDSVCLHHTAVPTLAQWIANESGLSDSARRVKRLARLRGIRNYYEQKGWSCGPHLFVDDRYIYLFSPMNAVGIHAKWGNSYRALGRLHYSIGIEIIGDYSRDVWSAPVAHNVAGAVQALQTRLKTFELNYLYETLSSKPGMVGTGDSQKCAHPERLRSGGIASHRDFNKPECPGAAITEAFYMAVLHADAPAPSPQPPSPIALSSDALLLHPPRAKEAQCVAWLSRHANGGYTPFDVRAIVKAYFALCATAGVDPVLAIAQMAHETGSLTSWWSQRPRRNPAGIGVTGAGRTRKPSTSVWQLKGSQWLEGIAFASWKDDAIPAHIGRLLAYALKDDAALRGQLALIRIALSERPLPLTHRGCAPALAGLNGKWAVPGRDYADRIAAIATAIMRMPR